MASLIFDSFLDDALRNNIDVDGDTFYCMLTTSGYVEDKGAHLKRSQVTSEVAAAGGYVAGGFAATVTVTKDTVNHRIDVSLGAISVPTATITARKAVYYKRRGGAASADELVAVVDFGADVTSTNGTWALPASTLRVNN
jgi:hypothetical protein